MDLTQFFGRLERKTLKFPREERILPHEDDMEIWLE